MWHQRGPVEEKLESSLKRIPSAYGLSFLAVCLRSSYTFCNWTHFRIALLWRFFSMTNTSLNASFVNNTKDEASEPSAFPPIAVGLYVVLYATIFTMASFGNIMAILTCHSKYSGKASILLCYIASLATADLLFALFTTFDLAYFFTGTWPGGNPICKIQGFLLETSYSASILTLVAISYERYRSVASLSPATRRRVEQRTVVVKAVWVVSAVLCAPVLYGYTTVRDEHDNKLLCLNEVSWHDSGRQTYYSLQAFVLFLFPLSFMIWAHVKIFGVLSLHNRTNAASSLEEKQHKVTKMLATVTLVFFCCSSPFIVIRALRYFYVYEGMLGWKLSQLLFFANSACNPVLYCFYSGQFRSSFKEMVKCKWRLRRKARSLSQMSAANAASNTFVARDHFVIRDKELTSSTLAMKWKTNPDIIKWDVLVFTTDQSSASNIFC